MQVFWNVYTHSSPNTFYVAAKKLFNANIRGDQKKSALVKKYSKLEAIWVIIMTLLVIIINFNIKLDFTTPHQCGVFL